MHIYENICKTTQLFYVRLSSLKKISKKVDEFKKKSRKFRAILFTKFIEILFGTFFQAFLESFLNIFPFLKRFSEFKSRKNIRNIFISKISISLFRKFYDHYSKNFIFFDKLFKNFLFKFSSLFFR